MELTIVLATEADILPLAQMYERVHDELEGREDSPGWNRGSYPSEASARRALAGGGLYVAKIGEQIVGSFLLDHNPEENYETVPWGITATDEQVYYLYTLAVDPAFGGRGIAKTMIAFAEEETRKAGMKALRLDSYIKNTRAINLYDSCGFTRRAELSIGLEQYGLDLFIAYEKVM